MNPDCRHRSNQPDGEPLILAAELLQSGIRFVLVTIVKSSGSTPRKEGARMVVDASGKVIAGSVGGGALEKHASERALQMLSGGGIERIEVDLDDVEGGETGAICGGKVELLLEAYGAGPTLHLFGAGHVALPVARLVREVGFRVIVYDAREELMTAERFSGATLKSGGFESLASELDTTVKDFIVVMTHSHDVDYGILKLLLRKPFRYLGVIGSKRKAAEFRKWLVRDGFTHDEIARLTCPIGFEIGSHTPTEIAISIAAQLLKVKNEG